jgi:hypothetical protein
MTQWARLTAKAWLEAKDGLPDFKTRLETDPKEALSDDVRREFGIRDEAKLIDLTDPSYGVSFGGAKDESGIEPAFKGMPPEDLERIIMEGKVKKGGQDFSAKMMPSEWISYPPLCTHLLEHPNEPVQGLKEVQVERGLGSNTLTLGAWARIIAYMFIPENEFLQSEFEKDPATTIKTIVDAINANKKFGISIHYEKGVTALFRLGDPPNACIDDLEDLSKSPNTYARLLVRVTC